MKEEHKIQNEKTHTHTHTTKTTKKKTRKRERREKNDIKKTTSVYTKRCMTVAKRTVEKPQRIPSVKEEGGDDGNDKKEC